MPPRHPLDEEQRHALVHAADRQQHARRARALLAEREVLAQTRPGGQAWLGDPAARVVAVDEVDDLEDVGAVLVAVHHQQVGQRERRVAQDVGPDLRQLGLDRRRLHDRGAEHARTARRRPRPIPAPTPPMMHGSVPISSRKRPAAIRSGAWATEMSAARGEAAVLLDVAGDELGRARRDGRAQGQRVAGLRRWPSRSSSTLRMSRRSISMCDSAGVPSVMTMCRARRRVGDAVRQRDRRRAPATPGRPVPRTASGPRRSPSGAIASLSIPSTAEPVVGEAQRERQTRRGRGR